MNAAVAHNFGAGGEVHHAAAVLPGPVKSRRVPPILERAMRFAATICKIPRAVPYDNKPHHETIRS